MACPISPPAPAFAAWLAPLLDGFSPRSRATAATLATGALLAIGPRTVTNCLRALGRDQQPDFCTFHRVLNRNAWSGLTLARSLVRALVAAFVPDGPVVIAIDHTLERRRGPRLRPLTVPEIRHFLARLVALPPPTATAVIAWSLWRRRHQQRARRSHWKRRTQTDRERL